MVPRVEWNLAGFAGIIGSDDRSDHAVDRIFGPVNPGIVYYRECEIVFVLIPCMIYSSLRKYNEHITNSKAPPRLAICSQLHS